MMTGVSTPDEPLDHFAERYEAMAFAVELHRGHFRAGDGLAVCLTAEIIFRWTAGPISADLVFEAPRSQATGLPTSTTFGGPMSQLPADTYVTGRVILRDRHRNEIPDDPETQLDNIAWSLAEGGDGVVTLTVDADSRGIRLDPVALGSTVLTAEIAATGGNRTVTQAIDVIPGGVASMEIVLDEPVEQEAPAEPV